jgi:hypothetical protein
MLYLKCTAEVLKRLKLKRDTVDLAPPSDAVLGHWYVNLFPLGRKSALICMNEDTLLSFILFEGQRKLDAVALPDMFSAGLSQLLQMGGYDAPNIARVLAPYTTVLCAKTDSRSAVGSMNDLVALYRHHIELGGGLSRCNLSGIIMDLNDMPQRPVGWSTSWKAARQRIQTS